MKMFQKNESRQVVERALSVGRRAAHLFLLMVVSGFVLASCGTVRPSAERLSTIAESRPGELNEAYVERRGFFSVRDMGGPKLVGGCFEKDAVGVLGLAAGVEIVRVCFDELGPVIFKRHTHGCPWYEAYPNPSANCWEDQISEETLRRVVN